jgi:hypothetical protein
MKITEKCEVATGILRPIYPAQRLNSNAFARAPATLQSQIANQNRKLRDSPRLMPSPSKSLARADLRHFQSRRSRQQGAAFSPLPG